MKLGLLLIFLTFSVACSEQKVKGDLSLKSFNGEESLPSRALTLEEFKSIAVSCKQSVLTEDEKANDNTTDAYCVEFYLDQDIGQAGSDGFSSNSPAYYFQDIVDKAILAFSGESLSQMNIRVIVITPDKPITIHGLDMTDANFDMHIIPDTLYL